MKLHLLCLLAALPLIASDDQSNLLNCVCNDSGSGCKNGVCSVHKNGTCVTLTADSTLGNITVSGTIQTCLPKAESCREGNVSITVDPKMYWRSNTKCCNKDKCNAEILKVQPAESTVGTLHCPSCFGTNSSDCKPVNLACAESETHCLAISGFVITDKLLTGTDVLAAAAVTQAKASKKTETQSSTEDHPKDDKSAPQTTTKKESPPAAKTTTKEPTITKKESPPAAKTTTKEPPITKKESPPAAKAVPKESSTPKNKTFFMRGCGTKEGIVGSGIPLTLQEDTFYFAPSHGNPSLVPGSMAFSILLPCLIGLLLDKFLY